MTKKTKEEKLSAIQTITNVTVRELLKMGRDENDELVKDIKNKADKAIEQLSGRCG